MNVYFDLENVPEEQAIKDIKNLKIGEDVDLLGCVIEIGDRGFEIAGSLLLGADYKISSYMLPVLLEARRNQ